MILGLSIAAFTTVHVVISLVGIAAGLVWLVAQVRGVWLPRDTRFSALVERCGVRLKPEAA